MQRPVLGTVLGIRAWDAQSAPLDLRPSTWCGKCRGMLKVRAASWSMLACCEPLVKDTRAQTYGRTCALAHTQGSTDSSHSPIRLPSAQASARGGTEACPEGGEGVKDGGSAGQQCLTLEQQLVLAQELGGIESEDGGGGVDLPEGKPSRHLWLGNIPLKPNKAAMDVLFRCARRCRRKGGCEGGRA